MRPLFLALLLFVLLGDACAADDGSATVRRLFEFLTSERGDGGRLGRHPELVDQWLSPLLAARAHAVECDAEAAAKEEPRPLVDIGAAIFFDRWDIPTTCRTSPTRARDGKQVAIVSCRWGAGKDHPEGQKLELLVEVKRYGASWKIENIRHGRQEPAGDTRNDLASRLLDATAQSTDPGTCRRKYGL
jgi:hypothetical protein